MGDLEGLESTGEVPTLLSDLIEAAIVDREAQGAVFLLDELDRGTRGRLRWANKLVCEVLVE